MQEYSSIYVAGDVAARNRWLVVVRLRPVLITPQTTALQHPGFPGRPSCSRIESEASCALWVRVVVSLGAGGESGVVGC